MTKYLINSYWDLNKPIHWFDALSPQRLMPNPGDMVYAKGVMDVLDTGDVEFVPTGYWHFKGFPRSKIDEINNTYSAFLMPLADVFRLTGWEFLEEYVRLIRQLKIPVIVPSIGLRANDGSENDPKVADIAYRFCSTVLDHSAMIGLRGRSTARYLEKLGFIHGRHFEVIGCPSMYVLGGSARPQIAATQFNSCVYGINRRAGREVNSYIVRNVQHCACRYLVSQDYHEFEPFFLATERWRQANRFTDTAYWNILERAAENGELRYFFDLSSWKDLISRIDFSISCRIHGTILAVLMRKPSAIIPFEMRTQELAEFHKLPIVTPKDIERDVRIEDVLGRFDFSEFEMYHRENLNRYKQFLALNGLKSVFDVGKEPSSVVKHAGIGVEMKPLQCVNIIERSERYILWRLLQIRRRRYRRRAG